MKQLALALTVVAAAMVVGAAHASAVVLCKEEKNPCGIAAYPVGTGFEAGQSSPDGGVLVLDGSSSFSECWSAAMIGKVSAVGGLGEPVVISLSSWTWSKSWESSECFGPKFSALKAGSVEIQKVEGQTGWGVLKGTEITQGSCVYGVGEGTNTLALLNEGGGPPDEIGMEVALPNISGLFCDSQKELTARYPVTAPTPLYMAAS